MFTAVRAAFSDVVEPVWRRHVFGCELTGGRNLIDSSVGTKYTCLFGKGAIVIFALNQTLLQQESLRAGSLQVPYTTEDLIKHYNCGDLNSIIFNHDTSQVPNFNNVTLPPSEQVTAQEIDRYFRQELIYKRNERMGRRVRALLEEHPDKSFFFAFGAGQSPSGPVRILWL
ncbi:Metalloprotease [Labeo rohita]|uniref:Metalloprotease TIKI n=1 Tax=Labeo rohita TaxID=84645 RepID=A0A498MZF9_LABRO|nr:Metalloprotease [Labeo rohita]